MASLDDLRASFSTPAAPHAAPSSSPRADFACEKCSTLHENLPANSERCPVTGFKRGFHRMYDGIMVSTKGRRIAKFIDRQMVPAFDRHAEVKHSAKRFEDTIKEAEARVYEHATPQTREAMAAAGLGMKPIRAVPAGAALASIDPAARADSRNYNWPAMQMKRVGPRWQR